MKRIGLFISLIVVVSLLAGCGGKTTEVTDETAETTGETADVTVETAEATQADAGPAVGGTYVFATEDEPDTLDIQHTVSSTSELIMKLVGGSILALDPETEEYVPYLAESYSISEDGLEWTITFKEGLTWHDGTPFTAEDYAWTMERVLANPSPATGAMTDGMVSAEAIDDRTVLLHMEYPNTGLLFGLTSAYTLPLPKAYIERVGEDEYGRHPIGLGPFKFVEYTTGDRVLLERNPDFNWGPSYTHSGAPYIEYVEFRFIPEYATRLAGLEAGEIDVAEVHNNDIERLEMLGELDILPFEPQGAGPYLLFNVSKPPFDDIRVRKAFNLAINREELVQVIALGYGEALWGVITPATYGHWDGDREIGYGYDLEAAKQLMAEAGYTLNADGILEKDGQPLELAFQVANTATGDRIKMSEMLLEQFSELGVSLELVQLEYGVWQGLLTTGEYNLSIDSWGWAEAQIIMPIFHSSMIGGMNVGFINDPELDTLLIEMYTQPNREIMQEKLNECQRYVIEQAYTAPLFITQRHLATSHRFADAMFRTTAVEVELFDAYLVTNPE